MQLGLDPHHTLLLDNLFLGNNNNLNYENNMKFS